MRSIQTILNEMGEHKKTDKTKVFVDDDTLIAFPKDTLASLNKTINTLSKDLSVEWSNAIEIVDAAFDELEIPKPTANLLNRWEQYKQLISYAVRTLYDSRGLK